MRPFTQATPGTIGGRFFVCLRTLAFDTECRYEPKPPSCQEAVWLD